MLNDYDNIFVTSRKPGDVFFPIGMCGHKKLKDYFIDIKLSREERDVIPIIRYNNDILCVGDKRLDRRYLCCGKGIKIKIESM